MAASEVARFRQQQALQAEAAQQGLYELAASFSQHDFIEARPESGTRSTKSPISTPSVIAIFSNVSAVA